MSVVTEKNHQTSLSMADIQVEFRNEYFLTTNQQLYDVKYLARPLQLK